MSNILNPFYEKQQNFSMKHLRYTDCKYYPCHKEIEYQEGLNCIFCYCPYYPCEIKERGGKWITSSTGEKVFDCSNCVYIHSDNVVKEILAGLYQK